MKKQIALKFESTSTIKSNGDIKKGAVLENFNKGSILPVSNTPLTPENIEGTSTPTTVNRYRCCWCTKYFSSLRLIRTHVCNHVFVCTDCEPSKSFKSKGALEEHLNTNHGVGQFKCVDCKYISQSKTYLEKHINRVHKEDARNTSTDSQNTETSSASIQVPATQATTTEAILSTPCNGDESSLASNRMILPDGTFLGSASDLPDDVVNVAETMEAGNVGLSSDDSIADHSEDLELRDQSILQESISYELTEFSLNFPTSTSTPSRQNSRKQPSPPVKTTNSTPSVTPRRVVSPTPICISENSRKRARKEVINTTPVREKLPRKSATLPPVILTPTRKKVPTTEPTSPSEDTEEDLMDDEGRYICKKCKRLYVKKGPFQKHINICTAELDEKEEKRWEMHNKKILIQTYQRRDKSRDTDASVDDPSNGQNRPSPKERPPLPDISLGHKSHEERMRDLLGDILPENNPNSLQREHCKKCMRINYTEKTLAHHLARCRGTYLMQQKTKCPFCKEPKRYFQSIIMLEQHMLWVHNHESAKKKWEKIKEEKLELKMAAVLNKSTT